MTDDNRRKKAQAVFFSLVMVLSMVGGSVALAGSAAATTSSLNVDGTNSASATVEVGTQVSIAAVDDSDGSADNTLYAVVDVDNNQQYDSGTDLLVETASTDSGAEETIGSVDTTGVSEGTYTVYATEAASGGAPSDLGTYDINTGSLTIEDTTAPVVSNVQVSDKTDTDGVVADGDSVTITAEVSDAGTISSVTADASGFGAGTVTLVDDSSGDDATADDGTYTKTITVDGASTTDGDQSVTVNATDNAGNGGSQAIQSGTLDVDLAPEVTDATVIDRDSDGNVDAANVDFSEPVTGSSGFSIGGTAVDNIDFSAYGSGDDSKAQLQLSLDTNEIPGTTTAEVTYTPGDVNDNDNTAISLAAIGENDLTETDGAAPVISNFVIEDTGNIVGSFDSSESLDSASTTFSGPEGVASESPDATSTTSFSYEYVTGVSTNGEYTFTLSSGADAAGNSISSQSASVIVGNVKGASITASPNGGDLSSTHTAAMSVGSETTVSTFEIDYNTEVVSGVDSSNIKTFGIDADGNGQLDSGETSLTAANVNDTDGTALVVEADSAQTLSAGEGLIVEYDGATNLGSNTAVDLYLDPDQDDATATRTLAIDGGSAATVSSITPDSVNEGDVGTVDVTVDFSSEVDQNTAPAVEVRGVDGSPIAVTGSFDDATTWSGTFDLSDNNEDVTGTINVSGVVDDAGNDVSGEEDLTVDTLPLGINSATTVEDGDTDNVGSIEVALNDTVGTLNVDSFSVEDDGASYTSIGVTDADSNDNIVTVTLDGGSVAADGGLNVTLAGGSTTDDAGNGVGGSEKVTATDGIAPDVESISATNPQSNDVNLNISVDEELATLIVDESGESLSKSDFEAVEQNNDVYWYNATLTKVGQGTFTYDVTSAADAAGNDNQAAGGLTDSVTLDTEAPSITANTPSDGAVVTDSNQVFTVDITDTDGVNSSSIRVSLADADGKQLDRARVGTTDGLSYDSGANTLTIDPSGAANFGDYADGTLTLDVEAADANGFDTAQTFTYEVDTQTDATTGLVQAGETVNVTSSDTIDVQYEYEETSPSEVLVTLDSGATDYTETVDDSQYAADGSTKTITLNLADIGPAEDEYDVMVKVKDSDTTNDYTPVSAGTIVVDDTAPDVSSVDVVDNTVGTTNFTADVVDDEADATGVANVVFNVSGEGIETEYDIGSSVVSYDSNANVYVFDTEAAGLSLDGTYTVNVTAVDYVSNEGENLNTEFAINSDQPTLDHIESEVGSNEITLEFSEVVGSADAELSPDDFAYTDNSDGNEYITDASSDGSNVTLTLSDTVDTNDLETDTVNVRTNAVNDTEPTGNLRFAPVQAVTLSDTTNPTAPLLTDVSNVTAGNENSYSVNVEADTAATADVRILNNSGEVFDQKTITLTADSGTADFDLTAIEQGDVTIEANVTDLGADLTSENSVRTVQKDNVSATIKSVQTNAGTDKLDVTFSEAVEDADDEDAFTLDNVSFAPGDSVVQNSDTTYTLTVDEPVAPSDIDNESVTVSATTQVTDIVDTQADTSAVSLEDGSDPGVMFADASNGSNSVDVYFNESVYNASDDGLTADDFIYGNVSGVSHTVESVEHTAGDRMATVTLDSSLTADDLNSDVIEVTANDSVDKQTTTGTVIFEIVNISEFEVSNTTDTSTEEVQVSFTADEELDTLTVDLFATNDLPEFEPDNDVVELDEEDFEVTAQDDGTYEYTYNYTVPRDGEYNAKLMDGTAVGGSSVFQSPSDSTAVDYDDPEIVDAEIVDADGSSTTVDVQFSEPVDAAGDFDISNITIDGESAVGLADDGIVFGTVIATGDEQEITLGEDTGYEFYGDNTALTGTSEKVDTHEFHLSKGVNFVSVPAEFGSLDIADSEFSDMTVMTYEDGEWLTYAPDRDDDYLESMEGGQGYIVNAGSDATVDVTVRNEESGDSAIDATPGQQQLQEGWNLVGHWQEGTQPAADGPGGALDSVGGDSTATNVYGQTDDGEFSYTTVDTFEPGEAYWTFLEDDEVYTASNYANIE